MMATTIISSTRVKPRELPCDRVVMSALRTESEPRRFRGAAPMPCPSPHDRHEPEDGQVHGDHEPADDDAEDYDHDRLEQRGEAAHRRVDLIVVEVGDPGQHLLHRS